MIIIEEILQLNEKKFENYNIEVIKDNEKEEGKIVLKNSKDNLITTIEYSEKKRIKAIRTIEKILSTKIELKNLRENEILPYIENEDFSKTLWSPIGKAMNDFKMVQAGDRVAVGVSGGKDSMTVLNALLRVKKITRINFEIIPIHIHPEEDLAETTEIVNYCKKMGLELQIIKTNLSEMLFGEKEVKNPCFLCARIRRGILYTTMKEQKINKLALGHHKDDIIETFLMNTFYQGNNNMMKPAYTSEEYGVMVIRPLAYVEEIDIIRYIKRMNIEILVSKCPYETDKNSKRLKIKNLIKELSLENKNIRSVIFKSIENLLK
ncbi:MAG: tRNA 2-thiocytidine biosynthesis TtcA family protein [Fusobacteriaceae bacterium]